MALDPILGAGYIPKSSSFTAIVEGTNTGGQLFLTAGNPTKTLAITIPEPLRVDLLQLTLTISFTNLIVPVEYSVKYNNSAILSGGTRADPVLQPLLLYQGPVGTILTLDRGDILTLTCFATLAGADEVKILGSLGVFGTFI